MKRFICFLLLLCLFPFEVFAQRRTDYAVFHTKKYRQQKRKVSNTNSCETFGRKKVFPSGSKNGNYYRRTPKNKSHHENDNHVSKCEPKIYKQMQDQLRKAQNIADDISDLSHDKKDTLSVSKTTNYLKRDTTGHWGVSKTIKTDFRKWIRKNRNKHKNKVNDRISEKQDELRLEKKIYLDEATRLEALHESLCNPKTLVDPCPELDTFLEGSLDIKGYQQYVSALGYARTNSSEPAEYEMITLDVYNKSPDKYPFLKKQATKLNKDKEKHKSEKDYVPKEGMCGGCNNLYEKQKEAFDLNDLDKAKKYTDLLLEIKCEKIVKPTEDCSEVTKGYEAGIEEFLVSKADLETKTKKLSSSYDKANDFVDADGKRCGSCAEIENKLKGMDQKSAPYKDLSAFAVKKECAVPETEKEEPSCDTIMSDLRKEIQAAKDYPLVSVLNETSETYKKALENECIYCGEQIDSEVKEDIKTNGNPILSCEQYKTGKIEVTPNQKFYCNEAKGNKLCNEGEAAWTKQAYSSGGVYGEFADNNVKMRCFCDPNNNRVVNLTCCDMTATELKVLKNSVTSPPELVKEQTVNGVKKVSSQKVESVDDLKYLCKDRKYQLAEKWKTFSEKMEKACYVSDTNEKIGYLFSEKVSVDISISPTTFSSSQDTIPD